MVKEYDVSITGTFQTVLKVQAESAAEAERIAADRWKEEKHVFGTEDLTGVGFGAAEERGQDSEAELMDILIVEPGQYPRMTKIRGDLESLQHAVGGYIQAVYPFEDPVAIVCDEEGKMNGSQLNRSITDGNGGIIDIIAGTFFVCGTGDDDLVSLPVDLRDKYEAMFHQPESFLKLGSRIISVPMEPPERNVPAAGHGHEER